MDADASPNRAFTSPPTPSDTPWDATRLQQAFSHATPPLLSRLLGVGKPRAVCAHSSRCERYLPAGTLGTERWHHLRKRRLHRRH